MALAGEWDELVAEVRRLDGFHDFLRPPSPDSLRAAAAQGPVVVVNVSRWRCDALVVTPDGVDVVRLPDLSTDELSRRTAAYLNALRDGTSVLPGLSFTAALAARAEQRRHREEVLRSTTAWLWDVVAEPVLESPGITALLAEGDTPGRVWWCPTNLLTLLPLHGAGHHDAADGRTVLDHVVSSYTPTLRVLAESRSPLPDRPGPAPLLFVGVPDVPDQVGLADDVAAERDFLEACFPDGLTVLEGPEATVGATQEAMAAHRRIHLSCHGHQALDDASAAGFMLSDGTLGVVRLSANRYAGEFAYLSACRTATGGLDLPDEVITLAAALNYTGYRHVVATLWSVDSEVAAEVTRAVYPALIEDGAFLPDRSAHALHSAVKALRDDGRPLDDWLPFTHTGP